MLARVGDIRKDRTLALGEDLKSRLWDVTSGERPGGDRAETELKWGFVEKRGVDCIVILLWEEMGRGKS